MRTGIPCKGILVLVIMYGVVLLSDSRSSLEYICLTPSRIIADLFSVLDDFL